MNTTINPETTVGQLVTERPDRSRIFETLNIDYCCGGNRSLSEACSKRGLNVETVIERIERADAESEHAGDQIDPDAMSLIDLADHIEQEHHAYLRMELPRLDAITEKVCRVHGDADPRLADVRNAFCALRDELTTHMLSEEQIVFPWVREIEGSGGAPPKAQGSIADSIRQMEAEHDAAGEALAILRASTNAYQPPEWACNTYRAMLDGLARFERDMHLHIHKENNVLFPKAIEMERQLQAT